MSAILRFSSARRSQSERLTMWNGGDRTSSRGRGSVKGNVWVPRISTARLVPPEVLGLLEHRIGTGLFGNVFSPAECMRILCWFGEPGLASLPESIKRMLTQEVKLVWDKPLPPSKRSGSGLVL